MQLKHRYLLHLDYYVWGISFPPHFSTIRQNLNNKPHEYSEMTSTPFPAVLPHVMRLPDGRVVELCCPICNGNARPSSPNPFLNGTKAVMNHVARMHKGAAYKKPQDLLNWAGLRVLTDAELKSLEDGEYAGIIEKRAVAKQHGQNAQLVKEKASMPIPHYPHIVLLKDGRFIQLKCVFCEGNAQTVRGGDRFGGNSNSKLVFFNGVEGMRGHVSNAHKTKMGAQTVTYDWVVQNCGKELPEEVMDLLKTDTLASLLEMVKAPGKDGGGAQSSEVYGVSDSVDADGQADEEDLLNDELGADAVEDDTASDVDAEEERGN